MPMLKIVISMDEQEALSEFSSLELRTPQAQALLIIREELIRRGFLPPQIPAPKADLQKALDGGMGL